VRDATRLGALMPFQLAAQTYTEMVGVGLSASTVERLVHAAGTRWAEIEQAEAEAAWQPPDKGCVPAPREAIQPSSPIMNVSHDGTMINIRGEGWKEAKVATISAVVAKDGVTEGESPVKLSDHSYRAGLWNAQQFGKEQWAEAKRRGVPAAKVVLSINDGARWIWILILTCYPQAVEIVDWWHAVKRLWDVAQRVFGEASSKAQTWVETQKDALWQGQIASIVSAMQALKPAHVATQEFIQQSMGYFETNGARMQYAAFRKAGYPVGSGAVEGGGCKLVVGARMKQAGMRWSRPGAQAVLSLRSALYSNRWDAIWASPVGVT
jgi:hypothetical protein